MSGIVNSEVHLLRVEPEFDLLGTCIYADLSALPGLFSKRDLDSLGSSPTVRDIGGLYSRRRKMTGYANAWVGKAFEYAVAELFNRRMEPHYALIREGIDTTMSKLVSGKVSRVSLDIDSLSCVRVAKECAYAEDLITEFGRFRILRDARRGVENTARMHPGLVHKVDLIFCESNANPTYRFAVLTSLKYNPAALAPSIAGLDFQTYPIDLAITIETTKRSGVRIDPALGVPIVHLPLNGDVCMYAWEKATDIVQTSLREGDRNVILRYFRKYFRSDTAEDYWIRFLADRLNADIGDVVQEAHQMLPEASGERTAIIPVLLGAKRDTVLDLGVAA